MLLGGRGWGRWRGLRRTPYIKLVVLIKLVHTVVAHADSFIVQPQLGREPWTCLHCNPVRCKVVPHIVVIESVERR